MSARPDEGLEPPGQPALSAEEIVRRAAQLGFDPVRVATALGIEVDPQRLELVAPEPPAQRRFGR